MTFGFKCLSDKPLSPETVKSDRTKVNEFGDCGLGKKALYVGAFGVPRFAYIPIKQVDRVYKRLAVSKGFYEKGKIFGSIAYLVIMYDGGKEKIYRYNNEDLLNALLEDIKTSTNIPVGKP